ncbi:uncharacterized protein LOC107371885 [Tetranychus urticae]|uniref:BACK domain-containing protein n=1 Tax=Tetranychus urticae TaxID=32264 RepID=T1JY77_TETUR|nr:uncharacterized protein LOC107371885 [Tetranychus urticae]
MDTFKVENQLTIVNRSTERRISKNLIRKIPYFEMMLSHDLLESRENKVELDFDEQALQSILNWIEFGDISISMDYVINLCNLVDYFGIQDYSIDDCVTYFHDKFTIEYLPVVLSQVTSSSKLINSDVLNAFICRYFSKIANSTVWLNYPLETIEYICMLELMVHSEMQVFDAIMRWTNFKFDSRKCYLARLLKLVRWHHMEDKDLSKIQKNELFESNPKYYSDDKGNCDRNCNRTEQEYFVMIEEYRSKITYIRIIVLANNLQPLLNRMLKLDESLPEHIIHDEHISDIHYVLSDSGNKIIRIDWKHNKYRWLDFSAYSNKLLKCISIDSTDGESFMVKVPFNQNFKYRRTLLEAKDEFILVSKDEHSFRYWSKPTADKVKNSDPISGYSYIAHKETVLDNKIYVLTTDLEFIQLDIDRNCEFKMIGLQIFNEGLRFRNLQLTSKQANDDRVILIDETQKKFYCFNVNTQQWSSIGQIIEAQSCNFPGDRKRTKLESFTSAFLPVDIIDLA